MRRLPAQAPFRRQAELRAAEAIARRLSGLLMPQIETVWVAQSLLPFLWCDGNLGGREVRVLMTRLPMHVVQARLDDARGSDPDHPRFRDRIHGVPDPGERSADHSRVDVDVHHVEVDLPLFVLNIFLIVGMLMDIFSATSLVVPLIFPIATQNTESTRSTSGSSSSRSSSSDI